MRTALDRAADLRAVVGRTPLVELTPWDDVPAGVRVFAKLETCNPGGSLKDRPVLRMIEGGLARGLLDGRRLLDSSSGNAGIAYAMFGASMGIGVTLVVPANASRERLDRIASHGAELILTDPIEGYDHAVYEARRLARDRPDLYWHADQYGNDDNWLAHYETTGPEILDQVRDRAGGAPSAFVCGVGTGGSITGVARRLREHDPSVHVVAIVPETFPGIEGLKPLGQPEDLVPDILDESLIAERVPMTLDEGLEGCRRLAARGLFVGPSSGAYVTAAMRLAATGRHRTVVTLLCDTGERYGSTGMWAR